VAPFLADENFSGPSLRLLRGAGHDVEAIGDDDSGVDDPWVMARARREGRILLTFDKDFGDMIFNHGYPAPPGVVFFRTDREHTELPGVRVLELIADPSIALVGMFTTISEVKTRQRALPPTS
jgi:predicted nuclease of predicted toxin-antitoxin system